MIRAAHTDLGHPQTGVKGSNPGKGIIHGFSCGK